MQALKLSCLATVAVTALALLGGIASAETVKSVTIGVEGAFPPFNALRSDGQLEGFDIDVANEVCKRAALQCKIVAQDWDSQIPSLLAGKFDVVLTMGPNPKRREVIDFSDPYAITPNTFLVGADSPIAKLPHTGERLSVDEPAGKQAIADLAMALKGSTVGSSLSTSQLQFMQDNFKDIVDTRGYKSSEQTELDLLSGRVDAQFDNYVFVAGKADSSNGALKMVGPLLSGGIMATNVCLGIRKNEPQLKNTLDGAISSMKTDGTLKTLSVKWFKVDVSPK